MIWFKLKQFFRRLTSQTSKTKILAVYENDIEKLLKEMKLLSKIQRGQIFCAICGEKVDINHIGGIEKKGDIVKIFCDKETCLSANMLGANND